MQEKMEQIVREVVIPFLNENVDIIAEYFATKEDLQNVVINAGAVTCVHGRRGDVVAQKGDYTAELVGAAKELHAEVGASRAAVDAGYCEHERQIGQTGVTVRPKLYIACGISGQIQHIAGMQESSIIISINNDANAPINTIADYVITGNVEDVIPKLIKYYKKNSK
jgi:electron transfer flavoprotein alpha subunit